MWGRGPPNVAGTNLTNEGRLKEAQGTYRFALPLSLSSKRHASCAYYRRLVPFPEPCCQSHFFQTHHFGSNRTMDPLSIISGIVGITTAGATLASVLYDIIHNIRDAPREMVDIARVFANSRSFSKNFVVPSSGGRISFGKDSWNQFDLHSIGYKMSMKRWKHCLTTVVEVWQRLNGCLGNLKQQTYLQRLKVISQQYNYLPPQCY